MKSRIIVFFAAFISASVYSQDFYYQNYDWNKRNIILEDTSGERKTILLRKEVIEYGYTGDILYEYDLWHEVELINAEEVIELNNKKYIPYRNDAEVLIAKARVIKPDKSEIILDESKILTSYDETSKQYYKYFAFEGLQKGCIVEHYYVIKKNPEFYGVYSMIQTDYPIKKYAFDLFSPENLIFKFNVLNTLQKINTDSLPKGKNHWVFGMDSVPALKEEDSAPYQTLLMQIVYKLDENKYNNTKDISSFGRASQNVYANIYNNRDKPDEKELLKFVKSIKVDNSLPVGNKIRQVENYIKKNINYVQTSSEELEKISKIIPNKTASAFGMVKLFANVFSALDIKHQVVITSDRNRVRFYPDFESFHYLSTYLIYFPETEEFLIPTEFAFRYGFIPCENTDNYGLFIKEVKIGDFKTGVGETSYIPPDDYKNNHHNHIISVSIKDDFSSAEIDLEQSSTGYYAVFLQPYVDVMSEEDLKDIAERFLKDLLGQVNIVSWNFENGSASYVADKPLLLKAKLTSENLIEIAGNKYVFKVGELIGPQVEIYSDKKRELPLHDTYKREFLRKITIEIPKGYKVMNLDDLNMYAEYVKDGKKTLLFESKGKVTGDKIEIDINEFYDQINFSPEEYDSYRNVVNSAADFNKKVLIFAGE